MHARSSDAQAGLPFELELLQIGRKGRFTRPSIHHSRKFASAAFTLGLYHSHQIYRSFQPAPRYTGDDGASESQPGALFIVQDALLNRLSAFGNNQCNHCVCQSLRTRPDLQVDRLAVYLQCLIIVPYTIHTPDYASPQAHQSEETSLVHRFSGTTFQSAPPFT